MESLAILDENGYDYTEMPYFEQARLWKEAQDHYAADMRQYDTYIRNELEVSANSYADRTLGYLAVNLGWV